MELAIHSFSTLISDNLIKSAFSQNCDLKKNVVQMAINSFHYLFLVQTSSIYLKLKSETLINFLQWLISSFKLL